MVCKGSVLATVSFDSPCLSLAAGVLRVWGVMSVLLVIEGHQSARRPADSVPPWALRGMKAALPIAGLRRDNAH